MYEYLLLKDSQKDFRGVFGILLNIYHGAFSEITLQFLAVECSLYFVYILQDLVTAKTHVESFIFFCVLIFWEGAEGGGRAGVSFTKIHDSRDSRERERLFL